MREVAAKGLILATLLTVAGALSGAEIGVTVRNASKAESLIFLLFDSPNTFGDLREPFKRWSYSTVDPMEYLLEEIPEGRYALAVFMDINGDGLLSRNILGIPTEPIGFSRKYTPKGKPLFSSAAFTLSEQQKIELEISLSKPLGERGRFGAGIGMLLRTTPYRDYDREVYTVIPALFYMGNRIQIMGPTIQAGLYRTRNLNLAATIRYRMGAYEEGESTYLAGMKEREDTVMFGISFEYRLPAGFRLQSRFDYDSLGRLNGGEGGVWLQKSIHWGVLRLTPAIGIHYVSAEITGHDFGISEEEARDGRPSYSPGESLSMELGVTCFVEINRSLSFLISGTYERLDSTITQSPIVGEESLYKGFAALVYLF